MAALAKILGWVLFLASIVAGYGLAPSSRSAPCYIASGCAAEFGPAQIGFLVAGAIAGLVCLVMMSALAKLHAALDRNAIAVSAATTTQARKQPLKVADIKVGDQVRTRGGETATVEAIDELGAATLRMGNGDGRMVGLDRLERVE